MSNQQDILDAQPMPVRAKLAAAWTSFMFLYVYVDILAFFKPGVVKDILAGKVWEFDANQTFAVIALSFLAVPILMIVLSMTLPARACRLLTLLVVPIYLPFTAFNAIGESWAIFYGMGVVCEVVLLILILRFAWSWPSSAGPKQAPEVGSKLCARA